ncbi:MAG: GtrA family protein [Lachnospiraceae bacterium]|nr:GtrA family protein [Lachnospiraceae bacterium]
MEKIKKLIIQAFKFFGLSGIGWIIDFGVFTILTKIIHVPAGISNIISSLCGVTFVFFTSTIKTFAVKTERFTLRQKYIFYVLFEIIVILVASKCVGLLSGVFTNTGVDFVVGFAPILAKICVTPFTMICNFVFMKILTEKI